MNKRRLETLKLMGVDVWQRRQGMSLASLTDIEPEQISTGTEGNIESVPVQEQAISRHASLPVTTKNESALLDVRKLDWDQLQACVADCRACDLHRGRTQTVFGTGDKQARWMLIGEAPGADEDLQGEPFVGRAGQLLNAMLEATGFKRESVYIANIVKCRPPANRDPHRAEAEACSMYLQRQIELIQPGLILALGKVAAANLLNSEETVGKMRGRLHHYGAMQIPLVVTYHPAYLLRTPSDKSKVWQDLLYARSVEKLH